MNNPFYAKLLKLYTTIILDDESSYYTQINNNNFYKSIKL